MKRNAASILVFNRAGQILLQKRDNFPHVEERGKWDIWGGGCKEGEAREACAVRELKEEIGIIIHNLSELKFITMRKFLTDTGDVEEAVFAYLYEGNENPPVYEGETSEWFYLEEAQKLSMAYGGEALFSDENIGKAKTLLSL